MPDLKKASLVSDPQNKAVRQPFGQIVDDLSSNLSERPALHGLLAAVPLFKKIDGWLTEAEGQLLFSYGAAAKGGCIIDLGSYRGRSTVALCAGSRLGARSPVFAVDPHEPFIGVRGGKFGPDDRRVFFRTMLETKMASEVHVLDAKSRSLSPGWTKPVSLLFLDADVRYEAIAADFEAWKPHLIDQAAILVASSFEEGPRRLISELLERDQVSKIETVGRISVFSFSKASLKRSTVSVDVRSDIPYQSDLTERTIAYHVYYGGDGNYLYQPIPKCGCTVIKTTLLRLEGLEVAEDEWSRHDKTKNGFPGADHLDKGQRDALFQGRTNTFKFVFVRDPLARFSSAYRDKIMITSGRRDEFWRSQIREAASRRDISISEEITFEEFIDIVCRQSADEMDPHWRHQYLEGRFPFIKFDFIGRVEMMSYHLPFVLEQIRAPVGVLASSPLRHNLNNVSMEMWNSVPSALKHRFVKSFEVDFDTLQYPTTVR